VLSTGENFQDALNAHKEKLIGKTVLKKFGVDLPFLPRRFRPAAHRLLTAHYPRSCLRPRHSPSKSILTRKNTAMRTTNLRLQSHSQLSSSSSASNTSMRSKPYFIPSAQTHFNNEILKGVCRTMPTASESTVRNVTKDLLKVPQDVYDGNSHIPTLLPRPQKDYTEADNDILVAPYLHELAVCAPADGIHAWLSGDIVECIVQSDNIINTGFCPRVDRDSIDLFTSALTFDPHSAEQSRLEMLVHEGGETGATRAYKPLSEFSMIITQVNAGAKEKLKAVNGPSIMIVTSGSGIMRVIGKEVNLSFKFFFTRQGVNVEF
jgi:mannose-6-phosphate isomerase